MSRENPEPTGALEIVLEVLEDLNIPYHVGGSFASTLHGVPRQTLDADLVVDLPSTLVTPLVERLRPRFYLDDDRIRQAVARKASFNLIDLSSGFKIDLFVKGDDPFDESELRRSIRTVLPGAGDREVPVKSAEDTILRKLQWFDAGGRVSDRQWNDILGVLKVQDERLEGRYLEEWAERLGVGELLRRAVEEADAPETH